MAEWTKLKSAQLVQLNDALQKAGVAPVRISEIENELEYLMSQ
jgi:hypothetical protein